MLLMKINIFVTHTDLCSDSPRSDQASEPAGEWKKGFEAFKLKK